MVKGNISQEDLVKYLAVTTATIIITVILSKVKAGVGKVRQKALKVAEHIKQTGSRPKGYVGGGKYKNKGPGYLPKSDRQGNPITYRKYDVNPKYPGVNRGSERLVIGSNGRARVTRNHFHNFYRIL